jgi:hypothetical protein
MARIIAPKKSDFSNKFLGGYGIFDAAEKLSLLLRKGKIQPLHIHHLLIHPVDIHRTLPFFIDRMNIRQ